MANFTLLVHFTDLSNESSIIANGIQANVSDRGFNHGDVVYLADPEVPSGAESFYGTLAVVVRVPVSELYRDQTSDGFYFIKRTIEPEEIVGTYSLLYDGNPLLSWAMWYEHEYEGSDDVAIEDVSMETIEFVE